MAKLTLKVKKCPMKNAQTKKMGFVARVLTNGEETFDDICEMAGLNTTIAPEEIEAASKLMLKAAARALKNGKIVNLGELGKLYPSVSGKWAEKEEDLQLSDLTAHCNYRPSQEIREAIGGAQLGWATDKDKGEPEPEGGSTTGDGGNTTGGTTTNPGGTTDNGNGDIEG